MTQHSPAPGTPQTSTKAIAGAAAFMASSLIVRALSGFAPDIAADPLWIEAINVIVAGGIGGAVAWAVPNRAK